MTTVRAKTFKSGDSLAIRMPKSLGAALGAEFTITRRGAAIVLEPVAELTLARLVAALRSGPDPGAIETRDTEDPPERHALS